MINIIIPFYNSSSTIKKTLFSLCAQTKDLFFVTIVDDCSRDEEFAFLEKTVAYFSNILKIKLIRRETNGGPGLARQTGIDSEEMCDYLMFLDSDDELYPDAVGRLYREAKINQADLVISNIHMEATMSRGRVFEFGDNTTWFHGKIYSKAFLRKYHIAFTEEMRTLFQYNEDCYFNLLCVWLAEKKFFLEETTYLWRDNKNSLTRSISAKEFYYKYNKDYFYAQACALLSVILSYPERFFSIAPTISSLYRAHQLEIVRKTENVNAFSEVLVSLFSEPNFKERFYTSKCIMYLVNEAKQGESVENDIIFYPESIANWAKRHGLPMEGDL